jgi:hypothetical protein
MSVCLSAYLYTKPFITRHYFFEGKNVFKYADRTAQ